MSLPVNQIVGLLIRGIGTAGLGCEIFQEFNPGTGAGTQAGDMQASAKNIVQPFLLRTVVLAFAFHLKAEQITVETQAFLRRSYHNGSMVNAEEEAAFGLSSGRLVNLPLRISLASWKLQDLE